MDKTKLLCGWIVLITSYYWLVSKTLLVKALISCTLVGVALHYVYNKIGWLFFPSGVNPFSNDTSKPRRPYELDQHKRDSVLKQSFKSSKVKDEKFDAVVIGSGIGGLTTATILSKAGKKVLVLEQHDQAGGCCHTFIDKSYEFDVGIHYIGKVKHGELNRTLLDQLTDGQLEWAELTNPYDITIIGSDSMGSKELGNYTEYPIYHDSKRFAVELKKKFPGIQEQQAIDSYVSLVEEYVAKFQEVLGLLKLLPLPLTKLFVKSGLINKMNKHLANQRKTSDVIKDLTDNKDLQTIFTYCWADLGTPPTDSSFLTQAALMAHFWTCGAWYPVGGASEIAFNMIPVIERSGGQVLVNVSGKEIVVDENTNSVIGVNVVKGSETCFIPCPVVVSAAGILNTYKKMLKPEIAENSYYLKMVKKQEVQPGLGIMSVFVGLNRSGTELGLKPQNTWAWLNDQASMEFKTGDYFSAKTGQDALDQVIPFLFISFPSEKDPNWNMHPERRGKSTVAIISFGKWEWFEEWNDQPLKRRGDSYDEIKATLGQRMIDQTCVLYPQIKDCIDYVEIGTPVTNNHYLGSTKGEIYGLDHAIERTAPEVMAKLRPETDISGLFLTGQDVCLGGFAGAMASGVLTSCSILKRNVQKDILALHKGLTK